MNNEVKHTPTPWRVESDTTLIWGACDPDDLSDFGMGYPVAECRTAPISSSRWCNGPDCDEGEANAAHIVKCVNMHDELVEALEVADAYRLTYDDRLIIEAALKKAGVL